MSRGIARAVIALLASASVVWPQKPSDPEAQAIVERSRRKALDYANSLPDFVCTELVRRYMGAPRGGLWNPTDRLTIKLSYFQKIEEHKLLLINDKPTDLKYEALSGATGVGEFGGTLAGIFEPSSKTEFRFDSWKTVRKHRAAAFSYSVEPENSHYQLMIGAGGATQSAIVGFHGELDIDADTGEVLHFTYLADHIPRVLNVDYAHSTVDYDYAKISDRQYLLPSHSETEMRGLKLTTLNAMEFREYRKFSSESSISFDPGK